MAAVIQKVERKIIQLDNRTIKNKELFIELCEGISVTKDEETRQEVIQVRREISWEDFSIF
jgi:hypothetical protein